MKPMDRLATVLALLVLLTPFGALCAPPPLVPPVASPEGTSVGEAVVELHATGRHLTRIKTVGPDGHLVERFKNEAGEEVDGEALIAKERQALKAQRGASTKALLDAALSRSPEAPTRVMVWAIPTGEAVPKETWEAAPAAAAQMAKAQDAAMAASRDALVKLLASHGVAAVPVAGIPAVRATVPAGKVNALAKLPDVARIGLDETPLIPTSTTFPQTVGAPNVHVWGYDASGVEVGIALREAPSTAACLSGASIRGAATVTSASAAIAAGILRSATGAACGTGVGVAPGSLPQVSDATVVSTCDDVCWALGQGASIIAVGWAAASSLQSDAVINERDAVLDSRVKSWPYPLIVASAGNRNLPDGAACATSSAAGYVQNHLYSGLVVGGSDELGTRQTEDDRMYPCSSWRNPITPHADRELPELVGPAVAIEAGGAGPADGTSFAAAIVAGAAALCVQRNPSLAIWPEALRAILMASARPGQTIDATFGCGYGGSECDKDGHGIVSASRAALLADPDYRVSGAIGTPAHGNGYDFGTMSFASDFPTGYYAQVWRVTVEPGTSARVVLAWDSSAVGGVGFQDTPDADLDLIAFNENGTYETASASWDRTVESVVLTNSSPSPKTFTLKIQKFSVNASFTYFGLAFLLIDPPTSGAGLEPTTAPSGDLGQDGRVSEADRQCLMGALDAYLAAAPLAADLCATHADCRATERCRGLFQGFKMCVPACIDDGVALGANSNVCPNPLVDDDACLGGVQKRNLDLDCDGELTMVDDQIMTALVGGSAPDVDGDRLLDRCDPDSDGDGWLDAVDCSALDAASHPGAPEACADGVDNNCDGRIDDDGAPCADDGDPCTAANVCRDRICTPVPMACEDSDATTRDYCLEGECVFERPPVVRRAAIARTNEVVGIAPAPAVALATATTLRGLGESPRWASPSDPTAPVTLTVTDPRGSVSVAPGPFPVAGVVQPADGLGEVVVQGRPVAVGPDGRFETFAFAQGEGLQHFRAAGMTASGQAVSADFEVTVQRPPPAAAVPGPCFGTGSGTLLTLAPCGGQSLLASLPIDGWFHGSSTLVFSGLRRVDGLDGPVTVTFDGLVPERMYRVLDGGFANATDLVSDAFGRVTATLHIGPTTRPFWVQATPATVILDGSASCGTLGGSWQGDQYVGTCVVTQMVQHAVQVAHNGVSIDCQGTGGLQGPGVGVGLLVSNLTGMMSIRGCHLDGWEMGVWIDGTTGLSLDELTIDHTILGLVITGSHNISMPTGIAIASPTAGDNAGVIAFESDSLVLQGLEVSDYDYGFAAALSHDLTLTEATIHGAGVAAVHLASVSNALVDGGHLTTVGTGIAIESAPGLCSGVAVREVTVAPSAPLPAAITAVSVSDCPGFVLGATGAARSHLEGTVSLTRSPASVLARSDVVLSAPGIVGLGVLEGSDGTLVNAVNVQGTFLAGIQSQSSNVTVQFAQVDGTSFGPPGPVVGANGLISVGWASVGVLLNGYPFLDAIDFDQIASGALQAGNRVESSDIRHVGTGILIVGAQGTVVTDTAIAENHFAGIDVRSALIASDPMSVVLPAWNTEVSGASTLEGNGTGMITDQSTRGTRILGITARVNDHANFFLGGRNEELFGVESWGVTTTGVMVSDDCLVLGYVPGYTSDMPDQGFIATGSIVHGDSLLTGCGRGVTLLGAQDCTVQGNRIHQNLHGVFLMQSHTPIEVDLGTVKDKWNFETPIRDTLTWTVRPSGNVIRDNDIDESVVWAKTYRKHGIGITMASTPAREFLPVENATIEHRQDLVSNPFFHNNVIDCCFSDAEPCTNDFYACAPLPPPQPPEVLPTQPVQACSIPDSRLKSPPTGVPSGYLPDPERTRLECLSYPAVEENFINPPYPGLELFDTRASVEFFRSGNFWGHASCGFALGASWFDALLGTCTTDVGGVCAELAAAPYEPESVFQADSSGQRTHDCHPYPSRDEWLADPVPPDGDCSVTYTDHAGWGDDCRGECQGEGPREIGGQCESNGHPKYGEVVVVFRGGGTALLTDCVEGQLLGSVSEYCSPSETYALDLDLMNPNMPGFGLDPRMDFELPTGNPFRAPDMVFIDDAMKSRQRLAGFAIALVPYIAGTGRFTMYTWNRYDAAADDPAAHSATLADAGLRAAGSSGVLHLPQIAWAHEEHALFVMQTNKNRLYRYGGSSLNPLDGLSTPPLAPLLDETWDVRDLAWDGTRHVLFALVDLVPGTASDYRIVRIEPGTGIVTSIAGGFQPEYGENANGALGLPNECRVDALLALSTGSVLLSVDLEAQGGFVQKYVLDIGGAAILGSSVFAKGFHEIQEGLAEQHAGFGLKLGPGMVLVSDQESATEYRVYAIPVAGLDPALTAEAAHAELEVQHLITSSLHPINKLVTVP